MTVHLTTGEIEALKDGINSLISGAVIAFSSSVWGVLLSIILGLLLRLAEGRAHKAIHGLQARIDALFKRQPPEASLLHIANDAQQSKSALQELHERIGNRLQESVQSLSTGLQEALTTTLEKVMGPAINSLVDSSRQQSSHVLETLLNDFMSGMNAVGTAQAQRMNEAAASVDTAINGLADNMQQMFARLETQQRERLRIEQENGERYQLQLRQVTEAAVARENQLEQKFSGLLDNLSTQISQQLGDIDALERERNQRHAQQAEELYARQQEMLAGIASAVQSTQTQSLQMAGQHQTLLSDLQKASIASAQSSQHMDSLAGQLGELSSNLHATIELFSKHLTETARNIQSAISENNRLASHIDQQVALMQQLQQTLLNSAAFFEQGARQAHESFDAMKQHQQSFLNDVRQQFNMLGLNLQEQVRGIEAQARQWLEDYGRAVSQQTQDRMSEWNEQTSRFSTDMVRSIQTMDTILDGMERKR